MEKDLNCKICGVEHSTQNRLINHIKKYHPEYSYESYVVHFYFNDQNPLCKCGCGTVMQFFSYEPTFFSDYTKNHFPRKLHTDETKKKIAEGGRRTFQRNYGVDNPMELPEFIAKIAETKLANNGDPKYNNLEKAKQTLLENYGDEKYRNTAKMVETNLRVYGAKTFSSTPEGIAKMKLTKLENHGDENFVNVEKGKKTKMDRYGYECEFTQPEYRKKYNGKTSKAELRVANDIGATLKFNYAGKEFDVIKDNYIIEVDGDYHHPISLKDIRIDQTTNITNDYIKTISLVDSEYTLVRIQSSKLKKNKPITLDYILDNSYTQDFTLNLDTVIISTHSILYTRDNYGPEKLKHKIQSVMNLIKTFYPICSNATYDITAHSSNDIKSAISTIFGIDSIETVKDLTITNLLNELISKIN